jgi:hypothetical protein
MISTEQVRIYRALREAGKYFHGRLLQGVPRDILVATAQEFGLWKGGVLVAEQDETDILTERLIYDRRWDGKTTLEHIADRNAGTCLTSEEQRLFAAMQNGIFSLFRIQAIHPGSHAVLSDRLAELRMGQAQPLVELIDMGLSETGVPGALLATRLLDAGGFVMTAGVSYPFSIEREPAILSYLRQKEFGYRKRRLDLPENYSLYFFRLHRRFGVEVMYRSEGED